MDKDYVLVPGASGMSDYITTAGEITVNREISRTIITIYGDGNKMLAEINRDGSVVFGDGVEPDEAARLFWRHVSEMTRPEATILEVLRPYAELWAGLRQMTWEEAHVIDGRAHDLYLKLGGKLQEQAV